jgi:GNAT superfamily N-acetyltransferase
MDRSDHLGRDGTGTLDVRPMGLRDIPDGLRLCRAAGWNQLARDWEQFLRLGPHGARVGSLEHRIVATSATIRHGETLAWIGMVLVDPDVRGHGIGTRMLDAAVALVSDLPLVGLDATPAGEPIYRKRGFVEDYRLRRMQGRIEPGQRRPNPVSAPDSRPMRADDLNDVLALDREVFGADRSAMLQWMFDGAPEYAWITREAATVTGYTFGRHGHVFEHLGPVFASTPSTACRLASACLQAHAGREFVVDALPYAAEWLEQLAALGFREQRQLIRMYRGDVPRPGDLSRQFAILGPEFG